MIAYGWIDGRRMKLDEDRTMQLIAPRQQQIWAETYKNRAKNLIAKGRMKAPGLNAIARSKAAGQWDELAHVDALEEPQALITALRAGNAKDWWDGAAPSYRRNVLRWLATAKKDETRAKRISVIAGHAARGQKVPNY
ncbi:MAG: YdeI/OmpD-associated family protein [Pseudomonadota bacterium]